jgi:hypothetical protein
LFGRLDPHLGRRLKGASSEIPQQVTHLLFRSIDQMTLRRIIHRIGHFEHRPLKILPHSANQLIPIQLTKPIHGNTPSRTFQAENPI